MNDNNLKERNFEADIEQWLLNEGGYTKGDQRTYDKERAIDMATLMAQVAERMKNDKSLENNLPPNA